MPCSRIEAPLAQCAPRLSGESNTGSWRIHTPFSTMASIAQPTEQCVQTVRLTSTLRRVAVGGGLGLADRAVRKLAGERAGAGGEAGALQERPPVHRRESSSREAAEDVDELRWRRRKHHRVFCVSSMIRPPPTRPSSSRSSRGRVPSRDSPCRRSVVDGGLGVDRGAGHRARGDGRGAGAADAERQQEATALEIGTGGGRAVRARLRLGRSLRCVFRMADLRKI